MASTPRLEATEVLLSPLLATRLPVLAFGVEVPAPSCSVPEAMGPPSNSCRYSCDLEEEKESLWQPARLQDADIPNLFYPSPSPSPETSPPLLRRRLELKQRPLPLLRPLDAYGATVRPFPARRRSRRLGDGSPSDSETEEETTKGYAATDKERTWHATRAWWGDGDLFPSHTRNSAQPSSDVSLELNVSHDAPRYGRWSAFAPELDLSSYNPPRPSGRKRWTHAAAQKWLIREERCLDVGAEDAEKNSVVWTDEELRRQRALPYEHAWWDSTGRTLRLEETLPAVTG